MSGSIRAPMPEPPFADEVLPRSTANTSQLGDPICIPPPPHGHPPGMPRASTRRMARPRKRVDVSISLSNDCLPFSRASWTDIRAADGRPFGPPPAPNRPGEPNRPADPHGVIPHLCCPTETDRLRPVADRPASAAPASTAPTTRSQDGETPQRLRYGPLRSDVQPQGTWRPNEPDRRVTTLAGPANGVPRAVRRCQPAMAAR